MVVPVGSAYESNGSFTRSDRKVQKVNQGVEPVLGLTNLDILLDLGNRLNVKYENLKSLREEISKEIPEYNGILKLDDVELSYWPNTIDNPVGIEAIYEEGFNTEDRKAHLFVPSEGNAFREKVVYDTIEINFNEYIEKEGIR